jgi:hypothetical protein
MGHTPTLMDYSRFNYVAQPEDHIDVADLVPGIGPYDKWATMWGYKPIPGARTPDDEKATLDQWARAQDDTPWLRFSTADGGGSDPGEQTEAVGDADAVKSTALGLKNLERVSGMLLTATTKSGENYDDLEGVYARLLGQWVTELNHVAAIVGGMDTRQKVSGQSGVRFVPISRERQREAVAFLNANAFMPPMFALSPDVLRRIEPTGSVSRVGTSQQRVLAALLADAKIARLVEEEAVEGANAYRTTEFLADVRRGVWKELEAGPARIDPYRRALQRAYLDLMAEKINGRQAAIGESRGLARAELRALDVSARAALARTTDRQARAHLQDVRDQISRTLDPRTPIPAAAPGPAAPPAPTTLDDVLNCWRDTAIRGSDTADVAAGL